jgi:hypothetical protein
MNQCSRDLTAVKINSPSEGGPREINLGSAYLPYDDVEPPPTRELERLVTCCRAEGTHLIIGCDANSHHASWGSTNINNRGQSLFNYIMANGLDIMNKGNRSTFVTCNRQEVIDITIATFYADNFIKTGMYLRKLVVQTSATADSRVLTVRLKFIVIHVGPTGSPLEHTCRAVCVK